MKGCFTIRSPNELGFLLEELRHGLRNLGEIWNESAVITANPRKLRISVTEISDFHSKTSCTLLGSTAIPLADRMWPRKETSLSQNWHLLNFAYSWCSRSRSKTSCRCLACSSSFLEYT